MIRNLYDLLPFILKWTSYMLTSYVFSNILWQIISQYPLLNPVIFQNSLLLSYPRTVFKNWGYIHQYISISCYFTGQLFAGNGVLSVSCCILANRFLNGILSKDFYDHFTYPNVAKCIVISPTTAQKPTHRQYAKKLLQYFVQQGLARYCKEFLMYNVHSLVHLADQAERFGSLDKCLAFPFENYLHHIKRLIRSGRNRLFQIMKRWMEIDNPYTFSGDLEVKSPKTVPKKRTIVISCQTTHALELWI